MHIPVMFIALTLFSTAASAQNQPKNKPLKLSAVAAQEIDLRSGLYLDRACEPITPIRVAIIKPPANGTVIEQKRDFYSNFSKDNPRFVCNEKKTAGVYAVYKSNENFRGTDKFTFAIVYPDGKADVYDVEMTVWR